MISELSYLGLEVKRNMGADSCSSDSGLGPSVLVVHGWQRRNQANNVNHAVIWYRGELEITGHTHGCGEHRGIRVVFWGKSNLRKTNMWSSTAIRDFPLSFVARNSGSSLGSVHYPYNHVKGWGGGGGGRKVWGASLGGRNYSFQIVSGGRHESFLMSRGPRC